ncbi:constitutive photomorphogenesis protein 10-like isoform X4 [Arachis ipaensis]|uniref:constitutive photomorphogenesis protein 10-like isoform X4 n=1 Tax=Arachis ipaensis TaxID=130454 RepID=UPI000A2B4BF9|nr:constitutive photomorphogenesis protein 10-like isoform X4 [Arachis ipaensis]
MMTSARGGRPSSSSAPTYSWAPTTFVSASGKRIHREMVELNNDPPPHCSAGPKDDNLYHGIATIIGPLELHTKVAYFSLTSYFFLIIPSTLPR